MIDPNVQRELQEELNHLDRNQQRRVVEFARSLAATPARGVPGKALIRFSGLIGQGDLTRIEQAVEAGCEQVNPDEW